jgi:hypothetical protein
MNIRNLLKLLNQSADFEYPGHNYFIQIFSDGSGRITDDYGNEACHFENLNEMNKVLSTLHDELDQTKTNWEI